MTAIQRWLLSLGVTLAAVAIAFQWIDRPLALVAHVQLPQHDTFERLTHIPDPLVPIAVIIFVSLGLWSFSGHALSKCQTTALLASLSLLMADATKNQLKYIFGRTWPDTWVR